MTILDKIIQRVLNLINTFISKTQQASLATFITKIMVNKKNSIQYDKNFDQFWYIFDNVYLDIKKSPKYYFTFKDYSNEIKRVFLKDYKPKQGDIIIDLGAGIGTELYFYSKKIGAHGKLYAIEANPEAFAKLNVLSEKNKIKNASFYNLAIIEKSDTVWIEQREAFNANQINKEKKGVKVKGMTLDEFVKQQNINTINLLKVNIEGAELELIKGMTESIHIINNIAISCHDFIFEHDTNITETIANYFKEHGFKISYNNTGINYVDSWIYGKRIKA